MIPNAYSNTCRNISALVIIQFEYFYHIGRYLTSSEKQYFLSNTSISYTPTDLLKRLRLLDKYIIFFRWQQFESITNNFKTYNWIHFVVDSNKKFIYRFRSIKNFNNVKIITVFIKYFRKKVCIFQFVHVT